MDTVLREKVAFGDVTAPRSDREIPKHVTVRLVENSIDFEHARLVRAAVWLSDHDLRVDDQFDENDWAGTLTIAQVNGDPAGTLRLRWFAGFASIDRMAIRSQYRSYRVFRSLVCHGLDLAWAKGYSTVVGTARDITVPFWQRLGGRVVGPAMSYHGLVGYPMRIALDRSGRSPLAQGADLAGDPAFEALLAQPEGSLVKC